MEAEAEDRDFPIIGRLVGRLLFQLARMAKAKRVLELGSGFGYSAYWFASAVGPEGKVICTDSDPENKQRAEEYLGKVGLFGRVEFHVGEALGIMNGIEGDFDIIFNDIDKHQYPEAFRLAAPRLRPGGVLISDNALWSGEVLSENPDRNARGILEYNRLAFSSPEFASSIVPLRDGVCISLKL